VKTSIALVSTALLLGAALARSSPDAPLRSSPKPAAAPPTAALEAPPDATSILDTLIEELLPSPAPELSMTPGHSLETSDLNYEEPSIQAIHRILDTLTIDLAFRNTPCEDVLAFIRDYTGLNIILEAAFLDRVRIDPRVTLWARDVTIRQAIRTLRLDQNYEWIIIGGAMIVAVVLDQSGSRLLARRLARSAPAGRPAPAA